MRSCLPLNTPAHSLKQSKCKALAERERKQTRSRTSHEPQKTIEFIPTQQQVRWSRRLGDAVSPGGERS